MAGQLEDAVSSLEPAALAHELEARAAAKASPKGATNPPRASPHQRRGSPAAGHTATGKAPSSITPICQVSARALQCTEYLQWAGSTTVFCAGRRDAGASSIKGGASGPAAIVTFVGNSSARLTDAEPGNYFDNGSIQHLSHDILDLAQFYRLAHVDPDDPDGEPYTERVRYMFRSNELGTVRGLPSEGNADQFKDGGGPAFLNNSFQGANDASLAAQAVDGTFAPPPRGRQTQRATFTGKPRIGHISALQRSSRAKDGTPIHIRMDGPGFDTLDVPDGTRQPKLQFTAFVPALSFSGRCVPMVAPWTCRRSSRSTPTTTGLSDS